MSDKLYWQGEHPLGGGKNKLVMGDPCPESIKDDPRYDDWIEDGTLSNEAVVNFGVQKQNELEAAGERIIVLRDEVESLKDELALAAKVAKKGKGSAAQKKKITDLTKEVKDLKNDLTTQKTEAHQARTDVAQAVTEATGVHTEAMAAEKIESGDIIAGLQLEIEELKNKSTTSGPKK